MSQVNLDTYESFSGSFIPIRDIGNNILSITSSTIPINDESQFIELSSSYSYYDSSSLSQLIDTNFSELTITNEGQFEIPTGSLLISQSDYQWYLDRILNLEEDLISSQSYFENELTSSYSENASLYSTVKSVADAALSITNNLIKKYEGTSPETAGDISILKYIWLTPFEDIITNRNLSLTNKESYYLDISQSGAPGLGLIPTTIQRTEVSYSLAYNGSYLQDLFASYEGETKQIGVLLGQVSELLSVTRSLKDEIARLENELYLCKFYSASGISGTGSGDTDIGSLNLNITTPPLGSVTETYKDYEIQFISQKSNYNNTDLMQPFAQDGVYDRRLLQGVGNTSIKFYKLTPRAIYDNQGIFIKYLYEYKPYTLSVGDVQSIRVFIDGVEQRPFIITNENLANLSFEIQKGKSTIVDILTNPSAWSPRQ